MKQNKKSWSRKTTTKNILYMLTVFKCKRQEDVCVDELHSAKQYLKYAGVKFISTAYHNDGKQGDLHLHALVVFKGRYSKLRFLYFYFKFEPIKDIDAYLVYIHRGVHPKLRGARNAQIIDYNQHKISDVFLSTDWYQRFLMRNLII